MTRQAPIGVTAAQLVVGMKVRRAQTEDEWRTITHLRRDGKEILLKFDGSTIGVYSTQPRARWEEHPETRGTTRGAPAEVCSQCGRPSHSCAQCGNEYDRTMHDAYMLHIGKAHTRTDGGDPFGDAARAKLGLEVGEPAPDVRAAVDAAMTRLRPTAGTVGDPEAAQAAVNAVLAATRPVVDDPEPVDVVDDTPVTAAARIVAAERMARALTAAELAEAREHAARVVDEVRTNSPSNEVQKPEPTVAELTENIRELGRQRQPDAYLEIYVYQPSAAVTITARDGAQTHLTPHPDLTGAGRPEINPERIADAERVFDDTAAGWYFTPQSSWSTLWSVAADQSVAIVARRGISRTR